MAKGNVIDQAAMMRAGFGRTSKGINPAANQHNKFWEKAATVVGSFAQKQIEQSFENLQEFKKQTDGQVGALNLMAIDAPSFLGDIKGVKKAYDKGARMASLGLTPQRRANGREIMAKYMAQLQKMSQYDKAFESSIPGSTAKTARLTGRSVPDGIESTARHNPGNTRSEILNTSEQANGRMKKLMRWDIDTGKMMIMRGGEWQKEENANGVMEDMYMPFLMKDETKETGGLEVWSEPTEVAYDDIRFGGAENNLLQNKMAEIGGRLIESATDNEFNGMWGIHKETLASELSGFLNSEDMDENAFKDFYFGGFKFDYSNNRMTASAPAFQYLLEQDRIAGNFDLEKNEWKKDENGNPMYGPGTKDWETKLEVLKRRKFNAGSQFRTDQEPKLLKILTDKYDNARKQYEAYEASKPKPRSNRTYTPSMVIGVDDDLGGTGGITKAAATKMAQTMQGKGTSYAGKNVKYVSDGKNNTTLFFRVPNAEKTAYEWVKQEEMSTNDALIMRGLDGLGVGYENIEQVVDNDGDGISDFIQRPLEFTTYTPSATDTPPATEPVNSGAGEGTKENPINLKEKGGNFEEGNWYIRDNGKTSLWTKRGWAKEKK